jgi:hypothetical protein
MHAERDAAIRERDKAQQMVAELRGALADIADSEDEHGVLSSRAWMMKRAEDALSAFDAVPGDTKGGES